MKKPLAMHTQYDFAPDPFKFPYFLTVYNGICVCRTVPRILNMYSQYPNSATSLLKTKFIFPKTNFYNSIWSVLSMRLEYWRQTASCPNYYLLYTSSWNCQRLAAEHLLAGQAARVALYCLILPLRLRLLCFYPSYSAPPPPFHSPPPTPPPLTKLWVFNDFKVRKRLETERNYANIVARWVAK